MAQKSTKWMWALIPMWFQVKRSKLKRSVKILPGKSKAEENADWVVDEGDDGMVIEG